MLRERLREALQRPEERMRALCQLRVLILAAAAVLITFELFALSSLSRGVEDPIEHHTANWQSFSTHTLHKIFFSAVSNTASSSKWISHEDEPHLHPQQDEANAGFDVESEEITWNPYVLNRRPITEVTAKACIWSPNVENTCMPESSIQEDSERGKWIRVEKNLNMLVDESYLYLFYRRLPDGSNATTVREFRLESGSKEWVDRPAAAEADGWHMIAQDMHEGLDTVQEELHLYYRTASRSDGNRTDEVNELDVVWGSSGTLNGWQRLGVSFAELRETKDQKTDTSEWAELMWRKGFQIASKAKSPLTFTADGEFKILQIADLHLSVGKGRCLASYWSGCYSRGGSDLVTLNWVQTVLDEEKPDLVILSGDQINGLSTLTNTGHASSFDAVSAISKVARLFEDRQVPWAAVLGNHDFENTTLTPHDQFSMMQALPYFVGEAGPTEVSGEGNYVLKVFSADASKTQLLTLYFLDSHNYAPEQDLPETFWDYISDSQITWYRQQSQSMKMVQRPFKPPVQEPATSARIRSYVEATSDRLLGTHTRLSRRQGTAISLRKPNAMAIFHMPVKEFYATEPDIGQDGKAMVLGDQFEINASTKKGDFFTLGLLKETELGSVTDVEGDAGAATNLKGAQPEVKVLLNGHNHNTDSCKRIKGIWSCFAGGSSYSGYSLTKRDRCIRVYQISDYGETISTYKIIDTHRRQSGQYALKQQGAGGANGNGSVQAAKGQAEKEVEAFSKPAARATAEGGGAGQRVSGHQKIDEQILTGIGFE